MIPKQFIKKAIERGWKKETGLDINIQNYATKQCTVTIGHRTDPSEFFRMSDILLDPLAWQAVGKAEGWGEEVNSHLTLDGVSIDLNGYELYMHRMIDALIEGKSIEEFLETL